MADNQVLQADKQVLVNLQRRVELNNATVLKNLLDFIPRTTKNLQRRLDLLRSQEASVVRKIDSFKEEAAAKEAADQYMATDPLNAMDAMFEITNPAANLPYYKNKITVSNTGMEELVRQRDNIANKIKRVQSTKREYDRIYNATKKKLEDKSAPTPLDMEMAKQRSLLSTTIVSLLQLAERYRKITVNSESKRAYTEDKKVQKTMAVITEQFRSIGSRIPRYLKGDLALDFSNPGNDENLVILYGDLQCFLKRSPNQPIKFDSTIKKYVDSIDVLINSKSGSKDINRSKIVNAALKAVTAVNGSYGEITSTLSKYFADVSTAPNHSLFKNTDRFSTIEKFLKSNTKSLYREFPYCVNTPPSEEEVAEKAQREAQDALAEEAFNEIQKELRQKDCGGETA